jgi:hypothetical protein
MVSPLSRLTQHTTHLNQGTLRVTTLLISQGLPSILAHKVISPIRTQGHRKTLRDKKAMSSLIPITRTLLGSSIEAVEANIEITTVVALRTIAGISPISEAAATNVVATKATEAVATTIIVGAEETHRVVAGTSNVEAPTNVDNLTTPTDNRLAVRAILTRALGLPLISLTTRTPFMMSSTKGAQALRTAREKHPLGNRRVQPLSPRLSAKKSS